MAKKKPTITTASSATGVPLTGPSLSATGASGTTTISLGGTLGSYITTPYTTSPYYTHPSFSSFNYAPSVTDGFYEDDGRLFWTNSKGEVFQVTFTKQETVKQILEDL